MIPNRLHPCKDIFYFNDRNPYFKNVSSTKQQRHSNNDTNTNFLIFSLLPEREEEPTVVEVEEEEKVSFLQLKTTKNIIY